MNATATIAPAGRQSVPREGGPQYMRALERANKVRLARADLKRRVAAGATTVAEVVLECPWEADSMTVADLLMSQRRWGQSRCRKFLAQIPMSETKSVGSMTERQRRTLAAMLDALARPASADGLIPGTPAPQRAPSQRVPFTDSNPATRGHAYA